MKTFSNTEYINSIRNLRTNQSNGKTNNWMPVVLTIGAGIVIGIYLYQKQQKQINFLLNRIAILTETRHQGESVEISKGVNDVLEPDLE